MFDKLNSEIKRGKKRGFGNYCGNSCTATFRNKKMSSEYWKIQYKKNPVFSGFEHNQQTEFSPFKIFLNPSRASMKNHKDEIDINVEFLKSLWEKQNGICPYTGIKMVLPKNGSKRNSIKSLKKASLDRIDSTKGYVKDNVEFVCQAINLAKNNFTKSDMIDFINEIKQKSETEK